MSKRASSAVRSSDTDSKMKGAKLGTALSSAQKTRRESMPSFFMREIRVVRFIPRRAAAP